MDEKEKYERAKQLAKISKRLEELKERLEGGQLKVDDIADHGVEYKVLKTIYEDLLYSKDMLLSLVKDEKRSPDDKQDSHDDKTEPPPGGESSSGDSSSNKKGTTGEKQEKMIEYRDSQKSYESNGASSSSESRQTG